MEKADIRESRRDEHCAAAVSDTTSIQGTAAAALTESCDDVYECDLGQNGENFFPESERDFQDFSRGEEGSLLRQDVKGEGEKKMDEIRDAQEDAKSSLDPLSYGPPSGSSFVSNPRPSLEYVPGRMKRKTPAFFFF